WPSTGAVGCSLQEGVLVHGNHQQSQRANPFHFCTAKSNEQSKHLEQTWGRLALAMLFHAVGGTEVVPESVPVPRPEQSTAHDCLQPTLVPRSRFQQQVSASVGPLSRSLV